MCPLQTTLPVLGCGARNSELLFQSRRFAKGAKKQTTTNLTADYLCLYHCINSQDIKLFRNTCFGIVKFTTFEFATYIFVSLPLAKSKTCTLGGLVRLIFDILIEFDRAKVLSGVIVVEINYASFPAFCRQSATP